MPSPSRAVLLALASGCAAAPDEATPVDDACADGPEVVGLMTTLRFSPQLEGGTSDGFDLDGLVTGPGEGTGCGIADDVAPDGAPGVDNAFSRLLPALAVTPLGAVDGVLADMISDGTLLLMPRFEGLDDLHDDDCAVLDIVRGEGVPRTAAGGAIPSHQTFSARTDVAPALVGEVALHDGTFEGDGFELAFDVSYLGVSVRFRLLDARLRGTFADDGTFRGIVAGGVDRHDVLDLAGVPGLDPGVLDLVDGLMASVADLEPDATGACTRISTTFQFEGSPAFLFDAPPEDTATP